MQRFTIYLFSFIIITIFNTCKTDFDVTAPYKETMVVYGLLNASSDTNWVRINKAFLGDGNAYDMAKAHDPDSTNYPDILDVNMEVRNSSGSLLGTLNLIRDSSIAKESGIFDNTKNILYRTNGVDKLNQAYNYTLAVTNRETGTSVSAKTEVVDSVTIFKPFDGQLINFGSTGNPYGSFYTEWGAVAEGAFYQLTIRLNYSEVSVSNPTDTVQKYVDWVFVQQTENTGNKFSQSVVYPQFYSFIASQLQPDNNVNRIASDSVELIFTVGARDFFTYINVNHPPTGANQNIPQYSNINGGLGIFSSRSKEIKSFGLNVESRIELNSGPITGGLFQ
ncbi:MAG: hypothetical protein ABI855_07255 [Bacteroidota bacterium]